MDSIIIHNQNLIPMAEARLSPQQAGLLMGWGVFSTLRIYRGRPFQYDRHWQRMRHDAERLSVPMPYDNQQVYRCLLKLIEANQRADGMARIYFVRNTGGIWSGTNPPALTDLLIFTQPMVAWPSSYKLKVQPMAVFSAGIYAGAKMLSWAVNSTIQEKAKADGYDDALLLNERGQIAECTSANVFLVRQGRVLTPPLSSGCLPGVTRDVVMEVAPRIGVPIVEQDLTVQDLRDADEVFISSSTREVGGVAGIGGEITYQAPGHITAAMENGFREYVEKWLGATKATAK